MTLLLPLVKAEKKKILTFATSSKESRTYEESIILPFLQKLLLPHANLFWEKKKLPLSIRIYATKRSIREF
jgi:hypothetical protein